MTDKISLPAPVKETFQTWHEVYSEESLGQLTKAQLESQRLLFRSEVERLKTQYNRGRQVNAQMAKLAGKEPLTHEELRRVRNRIDNEAEIIRSRFRVAIGQRELENQKEKRELLELLRRLLESAKELVLAGVMFLRELKGKL